MPHGRVKWFDAVKGYGFIRPDQGGEDVYVHISAVEKAGIVLTNDDKVIYETEVTRDGRTRVSEIAMDE